jgi:hypothetical protein
MVPGANLFFHTAGSNTIQFNTAITNLVNAGCDIVCDDVGWITQPFYEDGTVASHVNSVIAANDIIYVSSCGNAGLSHYQGDFFPLAGNPTEHDFSAGTSGSPYLYLPLTALQNVRIVLQWDDAFGSSGNDYDLYLVNLSTSTTVALSEGIQTGTQDPIEFINYTRPVGGPASYDYAIIAVQFSGSPVNLEVYIYAPTNNYSNNRTPVDAIFGHPAVDDVVSVGAVRYNTPSTIELFSSQGPSTIVYPGAEARQTPKIVGVDGGVITGAGGFGSFDGTNYRFYGTSAAAPHVAAILAQAWSFDLLRTGENIKQLLYDFPEDLGSVGFDPVFGFGRADALNIFNGELPVELTSFSATTIGSIVKLSWNTATEINNYGFDIERMSNVKSQTSDIWEKMGFVNGNGNSNSPKDYSFVDDKVSTGKYSYRLKQIDDDGQFEYSKTIEVDINGVNKFELSQNYPNPFNPGTVIEFLLPEDASNVRLSIFNVLGEKVSELVNSALTSGKYKFQWNAQNQSAGIYFYELRADNFVSIKKMNLLK